MEYWGTSGFSVWPLNLHNIHNTDSFMYKIRQLTASMNVLPQVESKLIGYGLPEHLNCVNQQDTCLLEHIIEKK